MKGTNRGGLALPMRLQDRICEFVSCHVWVSYESLGENDDSSKSAIIPQVKKQLSDVYSFLLIFPTFLGDFNPQKLPPRRLRTLWEWKNRVLLEEYYIFKYWPTKDPFATRCTSSTTSSTSSTSGTGSTSGTSSTSGTTSTSSTSGTSSTSSTGFTSNSRLVVLVILYLVACRQGPPRRAHGSDKNTVVSTKTPHFVFPSIGFTSHFT